jgi:hypothetical protein
VSHIADGIKQNKMRNIAKSGQKMRKKLPQTNKRSVFSLYTRLECVIEAVSLSTNKITKMLHALTRDFLSASFSTVSDTLQVKVIQSQSKFH